MIVHLHTIIDAVVARKAEEIDAEDLRRFLLELVKLLDMQRLFDPIAIKGKYGFTGIVGIVTSHIAFHFFEQDQSLHLDVYSCKEYDPESVIKFVDQYWGVQSAAIHLIDRDGPVTVRRLCFRNNTLEEVEND